MRVLLGIALAVIVLLGGLVRAPRPAGLVPYLSLRGDVARLLHPPPAPPRVRVITNPRAVAGLSNCTDGATQDAPTACGVPQPGTAAAIGGTRR